MQEGHRTQRELHLKVKARRHECKCSFHAVDARTQTWLGIWTAHLLLNASTQGTQAWHTTLVLRHRVAPPTDTDGVGPGGQQVEQSPVEGDTVPRLLRAATRGQAEHHVRRARWGGRRHRHRRRRWKDKTVESQTSCRMHGSSNNGQKPLAGSQNQQNNDHKRFGERTSPVQVLTAGSPVQVLAA